MSTKTTHVLKKRKEKLGCVIEITAIVLVLFGSLGSFRCLGSLRSFRVLLVLLVLFGLLWFLGPSPFESPLESLVLVSFFVSFFNPTPNNKQHQAERDTLMTVRTYTAIKTLF